MRFCIVVVLAYVLSLSATSVRAQLPDVLTEAYSPSDCTYCTQWSEPQEPFRIHGNSYYVGTRGLSAILITAPEGHVLIDAALPNSAPVILQNVRDLGFDPADIEILLNSHAHFDHAGGMAAVQHASGAGVAASPASATVLERGRSGPEDPQHGVLLDFPGVADVERFMPGDTLRIGTIELASHATGGHTPGGTSWSWRSCDEGVCLNLVYADSQTPVSADGFRFTDSDTYPTALEDFKRGQDILENLPCDILITTHPGASALWERYENGTDGLIDPDACRRYSAAAREMVAERVQRESEERKDK